MSPDLTDAKLDSENEIEWDAASEQPFPIRHRRSLLQRIIYDFGDLTKTTATFLVFAPILCFVQLALTLGYRPSSWKKRNDDHRDFVGLAIALSSYDASCQVAEIKRLGVRHLLLRIPVWEVEQLPKYDRFIEALPECEFVICIMQNREHIVDQELWRKTLRTIVDRYWPRVKSFQIGQGANRSKWGFFCLGEFLGFAGEAEKLRDDYPGIRLVGPGVLDFEPIALLRTLVHGYPIRWDTVGCALYVDRRGSPRSSQLGFFNLNQKIYHFAACILSSWKSQRDLWVTEVNWPIKNQGAYSPTCEKECWDEEEIGVFLREYYEDAWRSQLVGRVYWWQLVAKGFGLMDVDDEGNLRERPAYHSFKQLLDQGIEAES